MPPPMTRYLFWDATNKEGWFAIEGDEVRFVINIGRVVTEDDCCAGVAIKYGYHHLGWYYLDVIKGF